MEAITGNPKIDAVLHSMTLLVTVCSALASLVNHLVRVQTDNGKKPSGILLGAGSVLNVASVNLDKGVQFAKMAMGKAAPQTVVVATDAGSPPAAPPAAG